MDNELTCNYKKCRKNLTTFAWVTSCSHIFCDEDGTREFNKCYSCPACDTSLSGKYDIIRIDLQPTEQYKSMVLAGHKPQVIMEICTSALSFWTYQSHQEKTYQEYTATKAKERASQIEQYYEQIISRTQAELNSLKTQLSNTKKDFENTKKKYNELSEKLSDKLRQYQKLQGMYETLRRKNITPAKFEGGAAQPRALAGIFDNLPFTTGEEMLTMNNRRPASGSGDGPGKVYRTPAEKETFVLRPNTMPIMNSSLYSLDNTVQNCFNLQFNTPQKKFPEQRSRPQ